jgi:hypothetical protein
MSFLLRTAVTRGAVGLTTIPLFRPALNETTKINTSRRYSTENVKSSRVSRTIFECCLATAVGVGSYYYYNLKTRSPAPKVVLLKSALDPSNFVDFELKKVEPYNHNTSKYVCE